MKKGKLIVFEGINGAGKTTTIKELLNIKQDKSFVYLKGFTRKNKFEKFVMSHPSTFLFYLISLIKTYIQIKPLLRKEKVVLLDRYYFTVDTYIPDSKFWYNHILKKFFHLFYVTPDVFVYIYADVNTSISRIKHDHKKKRSERWGYRYKLINKIKELKLMQKNYSELYTKIRFRKYKINTTNRLAKQSALILINKLKNI